MEANEIIDTKLNANDDGSREGKIPFLNSYFQINFILIIHHRMMSAEEYVNSLVDAIVLVSLSRTQYLILRLHERKLCK